MADTEQIEPTSEPSTATTGSSPAGHQTPAEAPEPRNEDSVLALLKQRDLPAETIEQLAKQPDLVRSRKVRLALAAHPRAPRHVALKLVREFYTFDLMQYALTPGAAADLRRAADELLVSRLASVTMGERIALARRGSEAVAGALLLDKESRVWQAALENPHLTEVAVVKALLRSTASAGFVEAVCHHSKWSVRQEIRMALLRNAKTPMARALEFARTLPPPVLRDVLYSSRLPAKVKSYLKKSMEIHS